MYKRHGELEPHVVGRRIVTRRSDYPGLGMCVEQEILLDEKRSR